MTSHSAAAMGWPVRDAIAVALLSVIGGVFVFKYGARVVEFPELVALAYVAGYGVILGMLLAKSPSPVAGGWGERVAEGLVVAVALGALAVVLFTTDETRVDRLPAIEEWLNRLAAGTFPWSDAATRPSGLPALFFLAAPFHFLGNAGIFAVAGVAIFGGVILRSASDVRQVWLWVAGLLLLPSTYYEIFVRSELLTNMALVAVVLVVAEKKLRPDVRDGWFAVLAVAGGLLLSTRVIVVIPLAMYLAYRFRGAIGAGAWFVAIAAFAFLATILPFVIWHLEAFVEHGPFSVQMLYFPTWLAIVFVAVSMALGYKARSEDWIWFSSGILLFAIVLISFMLAIMHEPLSLTMIGAAIAGDWYDVSYFVFAVPFLILSLRPRPADYAEPWR